MRARNPSSGARAGRASGFLAAAEGGRAREERGVGFVPLLLLAAVLGAVRAGGGARDDDGAAGLVLVEGASFLAADDAVGAVRCADIFDGLVVEAGLLSSLSDCATAVNLLAKLPCSGLSVWRIINLWF